LRTTLILFLLIGASRLDAQRVQPTRANDLDFSGINELWRVVDILTQDQQPSDAQWQALLTTPGYQMAQLVVGPAIREDIELAFRPSRRAAFDSVARLPTDRAMRLQHLARAGSLRPMLLAFQDSLSRSSPVREAVNVASRFLPPGATSAAEPPLVAFALFRDDGYALGPGILLDLLHAYESDAVLSLAHELHHEYVRRAFVPAPPLPNDSVRRRNELALRNALQSLRNEGIADLIDKPYPLTSSNPMRAAYVARYNEEYARTPATLRELDSLLSVVARDSTQIVAVGERARALLWSNGHPNGAYIARTIQQRFGVDSLLAAIANPAALLRTYGAAEVARGNPAPFSPAAWRVIEAFERRYWLADRSAKAPPRR
jgi:hypothetical protein